MLQVNGDRGWPMRVVLATVCAAMMVAAVACGGSPANESSAGAAKPAAGKVAQKKIDDCGGFTAEAAAKILQISAADVEASSELVYDALRTCSYVQRDDASGKEAVLFSLEVASSVEEAVDSMATLRENAGLAKSTIEGVTGEKDEGPASRAIDGIGDEAIWVAVNGTVVARVGNVTVLVMRPDDTTLQEQVARIVATGLR